MLVAVVVVIEEMIVVSVDDGVVPVSLELPSPIVAAVIDKETKPIQIKTNRRRGINLVVEPHVDISVPVTNAIAKPIGLFNKHS